MYSGSGLCQATTGSKRSSCVDVRPDGMQADAVPELAQPRDRALALVRGEVVEDPPSSGSRSRRAALGLELGHPQRRVEREVDVVAEEEVARRRRAGRRARTGSRPPVLPRAARGSARGRRRSSFDLHVEQPRRGLRALERLEVRLGRPRSRSRGGRRRSARAGSSRPACEERVGLHDAREREHPLERRPLDDPVGSGPGSAVRKRIASGCRSAASPARRAPPRRAPAEAAISTRSTPTRVARRGRPSARPGSAPRTSTTTHPSRRGETMSCGNAMPSRARARAPRATRRAPPPRAVAVERRRVDVVQPTRSRSPSGRRRRRGVRSTHRRLVPPGAR